MDLQLTERLRSVALQALSGKELLHRQLQVERVECQSDECQLSMRIPPLAPSAQARDPEVVADVMNTLRTRADMKGWTVALSRLDHGPQGMEIDMSLTSPQAPDATSHSRDAEVARIRGETLQTYLDQQRKPKP